MDHTATYSPDDNKLRIYPAHRLSADEYARVKAAGFAWAPKQEVFVAPMWTPEREDIAREFAGEIGDEDGTLLQRAEDRADRFEDYHENRARDAAQATAAVSAIGARFEFGQPILVGHHSERKARKDAERMENNMRKAVKAWETAEYWTRRASAAIAHAKYKERPDVRARRIKTLEAERRKVERTQAQCDMFIRLWSDPDCVKDKETGRPVDPKRRALFIANREPGYGSRWSRLDRDEITPEQAQAEAIAGYQAGAEIRARWLAHYDNRLAYERAMLADSGYIEPPKRPTKAALPILNYSGEVQYLNQYTGETIITQAHGITSAEWAAINRDYKGTKVSADKTHRVRSAMFRSSLRIVYLTDAKQHPKPTGETPTTREAQQVAARVEKAQAVIRHQAAAHAEIVQHNRALIPQRQRPERPAPPADIQAMRDTIKTGIQVSAVPQLFPTPAPLAARMVELAGIEAGMRILEPSAGTGALLDALPDGCQAVAVELNAGLCQRLATHPKARSVIQSDFLDMAGADPKFDRIIMNPPFANAADVVHIKHAAAMLAPGGRLVAICANGPRQRAALQDMATHWEDLPAGTFAEQGTGVNTALLIIEA